MNATTDIKRTVNPTSIVENGDGTAAMSRENKKTTETGYINKNNQRNAGKTDMQARQICKEQTTDNICMPWSVLTVVINILQMVLIYG